MRRRLLLPLLMLTVAGPALAVDIPPRKPGLWEISMMFEGRSIPPQTSQHCIDAETDRLMNAIGNSNAQQSCSKQDVQRLGDSLVVDSVCTFANATVTSHGVVTGDFNSAYMVRTESRRSGGPAIPGAAPGQATRMTITAKWLGACKAGQKPGDIVMSNGMTVNIRNLPGMAGGAPPKR